MSGEQVHAPVPDLRGNVTCHSDGSLAGPSQQVGSDSTPTQPVQVELICRNDVKLHGHLWPSRRDGSSGSIIVNPATGVLARYYHRYASFLAGFGFDVLTYDYRGIGLSRPDQLRGCRYRWRDWGEQDFEAAIRFMLSQNPDAPLFVIGHSIGGFLPGLAHGAERIDRMLTVWGHSSPGGETMRRISVCVCCSNGIWQCPR